MSNRRSDQWSRREFLSNLGLAGSAALIGLQSDSLAAEPPPETTRLRLIQAPTICQAAQFLAEELLRRGGFIESPYITQHWANKN